MIAYEESLKVYRDLKAVTDTAYGDGYKEAEDIYMAKLMEERRLKEDETKLKEEAIQKQNDAIHLMILSGIDKETIARHLNISVEHINNLSNKTKKE